MLELTEYDISVYKNASQSFLAGDLEEFSSDKYSAHQGISIKVYLYKQSIYIFL